jgi:hypothetical protein
MKPYVLLVLAGTLMAGGAAAQSASPDAPNTLNSSTKSRTGSSDQLPAAGMGDTDASGGVNDVSVNPKAGNKSRTDEGTADGNKRPAPDPNRR